MYLLPPRHQIYRHRHPCNRHHRHPTHHFSKDPLPRSRFSYSTGLPFCSSRHEETHCIKRALRQGTNRVRCLGSSTNLVSEDDLQLQGCGTAEGNYRRAENLLQSDSVESEFTRSHPLHSPLYYPAKTRWDRKAATCCSSGSVLAFVRATILDLLSSTKPSH